MHKHLFLKWKNERGKGVDENRKGGNRKKGSVEKRKTPGKEGWVGLRKGGGTRLQKQGKEAGSPVS